MKIPFGPYPEPNSWEIATHQIINQLVVNVFTLETGFVKARSSAYQGWEQFKLQGIQKVSQIPIIPNWKA